MSNVARVAGQAANTLSKPLNVEEVFSTYLYDGNDAAQTITNGIDLSGEGGMVWIKSRNGSNQYPWIFDTERGATKLLNTSTTWAEGTTTNSLTQFNSDGFAVGSYDDVNNSGEDIVSWTFRKAPKFFDVVTYTGTGAAQSISHNLGSVPGMIVVKRTDNTSDWNVYHRESHNFPANNFLRMNLTNAIDADFDIWNATVPTDAVFSVGSSTKTNASGGTYVAYLFAHNDGDGEFGPDGDADIIKCGSYTGSGSTGHHVDLGFEPQWILVKESSASGDNWILMDSMRGLPGGTGTSYNILLPNLSNAEVSGTAPDLYTYIDATGFGYNGSSNGLNQSGETYIYIAIRRGPMAVPESATDVFDVTTRDATHPSFDASFDVVDMAINRNTSGAFNWFNYARLLGQKYLQPNLTNAENTGASIEWDYMDGWSNGSGTNTDLYSWLWRRAPNYFDVVAYTGNGTAGRTVSHNLGVAPEMIWVKNRIDAVDWWVYHKDTGATKRLYLNQSYAALANSTAWNDTAPTDSVFTVGTSSQTNGSGDGMIAYLFASVDGVSKVGSYTGNGTSQNIDCGFSSGARFVLIKRTDSTGDWEVYDTARGINAGNDSHLQLNTTTAQFLSADTIDPYSAGFTVNVDGSDIRSNTSGASYIFYAIA
jgi:hypothetical protein